mmetsp:Transcript_21743/g.74751  ORF Transcript_21743/g.74751 Transcript_21743/m.74751 type:complete len:269 (+) Transcript_21743:95-901(+)
MARGARGRAAAAAPPTLLNRFAALTLRDGDNDQDAAGSVGGENEDEETEEEPEDQEPPERTPPSRPTTKFDYFAVLDFECTCDRAGWPAHEIIEFPVVFVNASTLQVDFEFRHFVRPIERARLTAFCQQLTGIQQSAVDAALSLEAVLAELHTFLRTHRLVCRRADRSPEHRLFVLCTDGHWDILKFLRPECARKKILLEPYWQRWVDVRRAFVHEFRCSNCSIEDMLEKFGLDFEGRPHSGVDDARNIARILIHLFKRGCKLVPDTR